MAKKLSAWKTKGMNRDLSVSAFNPEFAFENRNLRLSTNEGNTLMSWVNEKGTAEISLDTQIEGTPIGTAVLNRQLVVFTTAYTEEKQNITPSYKGDCIYALKYSNDGKTAMSCTSLYTGNLNFSVRHPLETLVSYEAETIQKVYWTDGRNQPRCINIAATADKRAGWTDTSFDFVPTLKLEETVTVEKLLGANGIFAPGVIQYALTYYNKYGQESNVFYVSPIQYISFRERGANPEEKVSNAFKITVNKLDQHFDYLRIYAIQRTSVNATPSCRRVQDIDITGILPDTNGDKNTVFTDTGTIGDTVTPTDLLYKGGEVINALTMSQKDNSLFLGNINITRRQIDSTLKDNIRNNTSSVVSSGTRYIRPTSVSTDGYEYANQLTSYKVYKEDGNDIVLKETVPCGGFKKGDTYRLGVQFQYETGKWSDPIWIKDDVVTTAPDVDGQNIKLPIFTGSISASDSTALLALKYLKVRPLVVFPNVQDRNVLCQGIVNPTLYTKKQRETDKNLYAQASWFFRASNGGELHKHEKHIGTITIEIIDGTVSPKNTGMLSYTHRGIAPDVPEQQEGSSEPACHKYNPNGDDDPNGDKNIRTVEIQGDYKEENKFQIDQKCLTFNSPDIEFDDQMVLTDYSDTQFRQLGYALFAHTMSDIEIQTKTPTASNIGSGFVHNSFSKINTYGIVSGLFYDDFIVDDNGEKFMPYDQEGNSVKWMVYPWQRTGALNNDINRPSDKGSQTASLSKKVISNLRYSTTEYRTESGPYDYASNQYPRVFSSDEDSIIKMGTDVYQGNIDTILMPDNADGDYFAFEGFGIDDKKYIETDFLSTAWWKTFSKKPNEKVDQGLYQMKDDVWEKVGSGHISDEYLDLAVKKASVRMKYKSTPHLVFGQSEHINWGGGDDGPKYCLPIVEILQKVSDESRFGGKTPDAFKANIWVPCGDAVPLSNSGTHFSWSYGDTYFQRWDCLKTYAYTPEDLNQVIEIGSFMLESRVNIDGRYDKNRGQMNNLNVSPTNFNLMNPIYSQVDNFFQYKIQDDSFYATINYPNQLTWSLTKNSGADVDAWTNMTMASVLELDGDKGEVTSLQRLGNNIICFQEGGISKILYNENFMLSTQEGVPIEIANSGKVGGKLYMNDKVGCANKWSVQSSTRGIYFMDSSGKDIYIYNDNGQLRNISAALGFDAWSKQNIPSSEVKWTSVFPTVNEMSAFVSQYDKKNQEVLFINKDVCLCYSEKYDIFTSFYDYEDTPYFCNLDDTGVWIKGTSLWKHQAGDYCKFFGQTKPYSMILVGNPEPQADKIFTNLEFRACVDGEGVTSNNKYTPFLPFDYLETWNEYQHGVATLTNRNGHSAMLHHTPDAIGSLKRKFRIWRCDIPRDNYGGSADVFDDSFDDTFHGIPRVKHPMDRMRNPWLYLKLQKNPNTDGTMQRTETHDVVMTYFD